MYTTHNFDDVLSVPYPDYCAELVKFDVEPTTKYTIYSK